MGLARFTQEAGGVLTRGVVLGAPEYLAPEQGIDSHNVDTRADVYGLGATGYFMLTGQPPYAEEKTIAGKLTSKQARDPAPILMLRGDVPEELAAVVQKLMAREPARRYPTPGAAAEALAAWTQTAIPPPPASEMPQRGGPAWGEDRLAEPPGLRPPAPTAPASADRATKKLPIRKTVEAPPRPFGERPSIRSTMPAPPKHEAAVSAPADLAAPLLAPAARPRPAADGPAKAPGDVTEPVAPAAPHPRRKKRSRRRRRQLRAVVQAMVLLLLGLAAVAVGWLVFVHRN